MIIDARMPSETLVGSRRAIRQNFAAVAKGGEYVPLQSSMACVLLINESGKQTRPQFCVPEGGVAWRR